MHGHMIGKCPAQAFFAFPRDIVGRVGHARMKCVVFPALQNFDAISLVKLIPKRDDLFFLVLARKGLRHRFIGGIEVKRRHLTIVPGRFCRFLFVAAMPIEL